jgi:hypothetical protein
MQEQRWAVAERGLDAQAARRIRRTPAVLIAVVGVLVLAVAFTAVVDLRRLHTPGGAALAWVEAATFGNCRAYLSLSRRTAEQRPDDEVCASLRAATARARTDASRIALAVRSVEQRGRRAAVVIDVRAPGGVRSIRLQLVAMRERWYVLLDATACAEAGCY